ALSPPCGGRRSHPLAGVGRSQPQQEMTTTMRTTHSMMALFLVAALAAPAAAQQPAPTQRQVDSLAAQMRILKARLDSVLAVLARLQVQPAARGPARDTIAGDELAALRAAAASAAGGAPQRSDTGTPTQF